MGLYTEGPCLACGAQTGVEHPSGTTAVLYCPRHRPPPDARPPAIERIRELMAHYRRAPGLQPGCLSLYDLLTGIEAALESEP